MRTTWEALLLAHPPLKISMGFSLASLSDVNEREETVDFEGTLYLNWKDPRLGHDPLSVNSPLAFWLRHWTGKDWTDRKIGIGRILRLSVCHW